LVKGRTEKIEEFARPEHYYFHYLYHTKNNNNIKLKIFIKISKFRFFKINDKYFLKRKIALSLSLLLQT